MYIAVLILNLGATWGWVVNATLNSPGTHCTGGWLRPRAHLCACEEEKTTFVTIYLLFGHNVLNYSTNS